MTPGKISSNDNSSNVDVPTSSSEAIQKDETQTAETTTDTKKSAFTLTCDISSSTDKNEIGTKTKSSDGAKSEV